MAATFCWWKAGVVIRSGGFSEVFEEEKIAAGATELL